MAGGSPSTRDLVSALGDACDAGSMVSGALGLISNGRVTALATGGNLYKGGPESEVSTLFGVGSVVELLTAVAVARSEPIQHSAWVSDYVPAARLGKATVEQLLSHSSGLPYAGRDHGPTDRAALERFVAEDAALHHRRTAPGEVAWPTPSGYAVAGRAMEVLSSRSFGDLLREIVLDPAGMNLAGVPAEVDPNTLAWPQQRRGGEFVRADRLIDDRSGHPAGFLFASLQDLVGLAEGLLEGFLVDAGTWERMASQHISRHISHVPYPLALTATGYGLGCLIGEWNGQKVIRRHGRQASYHSTVELLPESSSAILLLTNGADDRTFNDLLGHCYEAIGGRGRLGVEPPLAPISPDLAAAWVGTYVQPSRGAIVEVADRDGDLVYREGGAEMPLYNVGHGRALVPMHYGSAPLWFPESEGSAPFLLMWGEPHFREAPSPWLPDDPPTFDGVYRDSFFPLDETDLRFTFEDGAWSATRGGVRSAALPLGERKLVSSHGMAHFSEDGSSVQVGDATVYRRS